MASSNDFDYTNRLAFLAEWFDLDGGYIFNYYMNFYPYDNSIELFEKQNGKVFLRRTLVDGVSFKDMFIGNTVRIYGRQMTILEYADEYTRKLISKKTQKLLTFLKPTVVKDMPAILSVIMQKGFKICHLKMCQVIEKEAIDFYSHYKADSFLPFLIEHICTGPIIAMELMAEDAIARWNETVGPADPATARQEAPGSLRAIYGLERASNGFHGPKGEEVVEKETRFFFPTLKDVGKRSPRSTARFVNCTCCIIKPHAIESGHMTQIITDIVDEGYKITAMEMFYLSNANADEFLEIYKGVVSDFKSLMSSFIDGPCLTLEITLPEGSSRDVHQEFRKYCGPMDPDVARQIRPHTLRARYGIDKCKNAVHCTDLPEDTQLELEYFFKLLEN